MGLFSSKKPSVPAIRDLVWATRDGKKQGLLQLLRQHPDAVIMAWFDHTKADFESFLSENGLDREIKSMRIPLSSWVEGRQVIWLEHYPLRSREKENIQSWKTDSILVLSALDEPFFHQFGGENLARLMNSLGLAEDEMLEHKLISSSIERAQEKIEKKVISEKWADSQEAWFRHNLP